MNYLAHIYLSGENPALIIGNLLGDMIRNHEVEVLDSDLQKGVYLHRLIDSFTDAHPSIKLINKVFRETQGKYAPVVTDIILDHVLALHWEKYKSEPFSDYCNRMYDLMDDHYAVMPVHARKRVASMVNGRWLHSYASEEGIKYAFSRLARRARFSNRFEVALETYLLYQAEIDQLFFDFFPDILERTRDYIEAFEDSDPLSG
jgi:acyl carrier protein phosphodiesterase